MNISTTLSGQKLENFVLLTFKRLLEIAKQIEIGFKNEEY